MVPFFPSSINMGGEEFFLFVGQGLECYMGGWEGCAQHFCRLNRQILTKDIQLCFGRAINTFKLFKMSNRFWLLIPAKARREVANLFIPFEDSVFLWENTVPQEISLLLKFPLLKHSMPLQ